LTSAFVSVATVYCPLSFLASLRTSAMIRFRSFLRSLFFYLGYRLSSLDSLFEVIERLDLLMTATLSLI
jgi:hypothetical protein